MRLSRGEPMNAQVAKPAVTRAAEAAMPARVEIMHPDGKVETVPLGNMDPLQKGAPMPKSLGRCADLYHDVRELRLLMEKECEGIKARETEIQEHIIRSLPKGDTGASGLRYHAQVNTDTKPQVDETKGGWRAVWDFIKKNDRFDLLQKRLGEKAIADMWEAGEEIPGVAKVHVPKLSITKI